MVTAVPMKTANERADSWLKNSPLNPNRKRPRRQQPTLRQHRPRPHRARPKQLRVPPNLLAAVEAVPAAQEVGAVDKVVVAAAVGAAATGAVEAARVADEVGRVVAADADADRNASPMRAAWRAPSSVSIVARK
jgi:hypothetical protein